MPSLTATRSTDEDAATFVASHSTVLRRFDHRTQDSGNVSWLVESRGRRLFVKSAGPVVPEAGAPTPYLDHAGRVRLLRNAIDLARSCGHPALPQLLNVIESPGGPLLVYSEAPGELVGTPNHRRGDPASAYQRFARLPPGRLLGLLDVVIDVHVALARAGWQACDLYDGCLVVDFDADRIHLVDLDTYRRGPATNDMGRMFGSSRFMAPEEHRFGALLDERTTVFTLGRLVHHFATRLTERPEDFCGPGPLRDVVQRACRPDPSDRFATVAGLGSAWFRARQEP